MMTSQVELINYFELFGLLGAMVFSKLRLVPTLLVGYAIYYRIIEAFTESWLTTCRNMYDSSVDQFGFASIDVINKCDSDHMAVYVLQGFSMFLIALLFLFTLGRIAKVTFCVVTLQAILSLMAAICVYVVNKTGNPLTLLFEAHSFINTGFAIIYVVIAWICVYLSWKGKHER